MATPRTVDDRGNLLLLEETANGIDIGKIEDNVDAFTSASSNADDLVTFTPQSAHHVSADEPS